MRQRQPEKCKRARIHFNKIEWQRAAERRARTLYSLATDVRSKIVGVSTDIDV